jgi:hypothetical protein
MYVAVAPPLTSPTLQQQYSVLHENRLSETLPSITTEQQPHGNTVILLLHLTITTTTTTTTTQFVPS